MTDEAKRCVEALRFKEDFECIECPIPAGNCEENCMLDVAADLIESLCAELEKVKRERDAAVEDMKDKSFGCEKCKHYFIGNRFCDMPIDKRKPSFGCWQWRGPKEESHD